MRVVLETEAREEILEETIRNVLPRPKLIIWNDGQRDRYFRLSHGSGEQSTYVEVAAIRLEAEPSAAVADASTAST